MAFILWYCGVLNMNLKKWLDIPTQCTFIWSENEKKKFLTSSPVEDLILFNGEH